MAQKRRGMDQMIAEVCCRLEPRRFRSVEHVMCSINLAVLSDTSRTDRMTNHGCFVRYLMR